MNSVKQLEEVHFKVSLFFSKKHLIKQKNKKRVKRGINTETGEVVGKS